MDLTRRRLLGASGAAVAAAVAGCTGGESTDGGGSDGGDSEPGLPVDATADFETRLVGNDVERTLFEPTDLDVVDGVVEEDGVYIVATQLSDVGRAEVVSALETAGVGDRPEAFGVAMYLDGEEIKRVDLTPGIVDTWLGDWDGVVQITFDEEPVARELLEALAA